VETALKGAATQLDPVAAAMPPRDLTPLSAQGELASLALPQGGLMLLSSPGQVASPSCGLTLPPAREELASPTPFRCDPMWPPIPEELDKSAGPAVMAQVEARGLPRQMPVASMRPQGRAAWQGALVLAAPAAGEPLAGVLAAPTAGEPLVGVLAGVLAAPATGERLAGARAVEAQRPD
jgi:hypothetical protein